VDLVIYPEAVPSREIACLPEEVILVGAVAAAGRREGGSS